jgi:predicted nucleic acid-binding protein
MDLERHSVEPRAVLALAVRTRLTAYDAAYLWLAQGLNAPLATFDGRLGAIAVEHLRKGG